MPNTNCIYLFVVKVYIKQYVIKKILTKNSEFSFYAFKQTINYCVKKKPVNSPAFYIIRYIRVF
jgi:hypothetical protein